MQRYKNLSGQSGVEAFDIADDSIIVWFKAGHTRTYLYTYASAGRQAIERMKELALAGNGLNSYIGLHVKDGYARKSA